MYQESQSEYCKDHHLTGGRSQWRKMRGFGFNQSRNLIGCHSFNICFKDLLYEAISDSLCKRGKFNFFLNLLQKHLILFVPSNIILCSMLYSWSELYGIYYCKSGGSKMGNFPKTGSNSLF